MEYFPLPNKLGRAGSEAEDVMAEHRSSSMEKRDHIPGICCPSSSQAMGTPQMKLKGPGVFPPSGIPLPLCSRYPGGPAASQALPIPANPLPPGARRGCGCPDMFSSYR